MKNLNTHGRTFSEALTAASSQQVRRNVLDGATQKVHVVGAGRSITSAYEQLRNAAENTEEHLLLQRAIRRFYKRFFIASSRDEINTSGEELVTELTLAGYLPNDTVSVEVVRRLSELAAEYYTAYARLQDMGRHRSAGQWTVAVLAVEAEALLDDHNVRDIFAQFAFEHFRSTIDTKQFGASDMADYELALYAAVHRALLKSDEATIRKAFLDRFRQTPSGLEAYVQANEKIDDILESRLTEKLFRIVNREGAVLRIVWRMLSERENVHELLQSSDKFLAAYEAQVQSEYESIAARINRGVVKSVIFLIITKFLIGIAIEVPYDYLVHGTIVWLPLIVNLFAPPLYMILLRLTLSMPSPANTRALLRQAEELLYTGDGTVQLRSSRAARKQYGAAFSVVYALFFVAVFGLVGWGLVNIGFTALHLAIFFVFFSTASFLGFRLSRTIRELETVESEQSGVSLLRDLLYMPFVVVGRWMSDKYSRINIVAVTLDMIIELPMKTVLRLIRQWGAFISTKKDEL